MAETRGLDPIQAAIALFREGYPSIVSFNMHEDDVRRIMIQPWTMTASDGGLVPMGQGVPHPRNYAGFTRKLTHYVLEEGVVGLPAAIRSMTSLPAQVYRIPDRGVLRPGAAADVVVFDPDALEARATFTDPPPLSRGMVHVWVNGVATLHDGAFTDALPGRILERP